MSLAAIIGGGLLTRPDQHMMSADDYFIRERVLTSYPFTYEAAVYLNTVPYFNRETTNNGGGYFHDYFPWGPYIETFSDQDEAVLHEMSHAFYEHIVKTDPKFPNKFMQAVHIATETDKPGGYFKHLEWGFGGNWDGIDHSDVTEYYASISSEFMGDVASMPDPLQEYYKREFYIDPNAKQLTVPPFTPGKLKKYNGDSQK